MVFDAVKGFMLDLSAALFSWIGAPELLESPLLQQGYGSIIYIVSLFAVPIGSIFTGKKRKLMLFAAGFGISVLFGSLYLALFTLVIQSALFFVIWYRFRRESFDTFDEEPAFDEEPTFDEEPVFGEEEPALGETEPSFGATEPTAEETAQEPGFPADQEPGFPEPSFPDESSPSQQSPQTPTYTCPECGGPLTYIPQYQRYYCYNCKKYV